MKAPPPVTVQKAVQIAKDFLREISFIDRVVVEKATASFFDGDEIFARHTREFPDVKIHRLNDSWHVDFPLKVPLPEVDLDSRYVIVNAITGEAKMGLA